MRPDAPPTRCAATTPAGRFDSAGEAEDRRPSPVSRRPLTSRSRLLSIALPCLVAAAPLAGGCTTSLDSVGTGGSAPAQGTNVSFDDHATLELAPSELRQIHATTTPGAMVSFLLIGDSYDASLDRGSVQADDAGRVTVTLKAPSKPGTFHLVATTGKSASDDLAVSVSELGFGSVRVTPKYAGTRKVSGWRASVAVGATCDAVLAGFPQDPVGALTADAPTGGTPLLTSVPVGPTLAVAVRSGALMWGCAEVQLSSPEQMGGVTIDVLNRPMVLSTASLTIGLEFAPSAATYPSLVDGGASLLSNTAFPQGSSAKDLLDAVRALVPAASQGSFDQHRQSASLDQAVSAAMAADPRTLVDGWLASAQSATHPQAPQITGVLKGNAARPGMADFAVTALGPVSAATAGVSQQAALSWSANADDTLVIGGHFTYSPTRYVGALLTSEALKDFPSATDAPSALAQGIDCAAVGPLIEGFDTCMSSCGEALCQQALASMWERGIAAADDLGVVDVAASGAALVDDVAEPASMTGSWVGDLTALGTSCVVKGAASGQAAVPPG